MHRINLIRARVVTSCLIRGIRFERHLHIRGFLFVTWRLRGCCCKFMHFKKNIGLIFFKELSEGLIELWDLKFRELKCNETHLTHKTYIIYSLYYPLHCCTLSDSWRWCEKTTKHVEIYSQKWKNMSQPKKISCSTVISFSFLNFQNIRFSYVFLWNWLELS